MIGINEPQLPVLTQDEVKVVLERARLLIKQVCGEDVSFKIAPPREAAEFLEGCRRRLEPYTVPGAYALSPLEASEDVVRRRLLTELKDRYSLEQARRLLGGKPGGDSPNEVGFDEIATALAKAYLESLEMSYNDDTLKRQ